METDYLLKELKGFLDGDKRLKKHPAKYKNKVLAWFYLASKLEPGRRYTEKEINQILCDWHTFEDWAMLRRELYDGRFVDREPNGSWYWLEEIQPTLASFGLQ